MTAEAPPGGTAPGEQRVSALSPRALVIGAACVAVTCVVVCYAELVVNKIQIGFLQLPPVVVGMLVLILGVQHGLSRLAPRLRLQARELFTIYVMMLLAAMVSSRGLLEKLIPLLVVPNYFATDANGWRGQFFGFIRRWAVPWDPSGPAKQPNASAFFDGLRPGQHIPWQAWAVPLAVWGVFVALIFFAYLCLAVILRRQWVDNERLTFPLVQLPLEMIRGDTPGARLRTQGPPLLHNSLTWLGFALPALLFGFNGLHQWFPSVPDLPVDIDLNQYLTMPPYDTLSYLHVFISLAAVGFFYLLPTDLLFSLWFFVLVMHVEEVAAGSLGYVPEVMPLYGCKLFVGYQLIGAYFVLVGYMVWAARPHLARVWRAATTPPWRREASSGGDDEALSYRTAFWGLAAAILLSSAWLWLLGMAYWLALFELCVLLFVVALVMARSTCESGMLMTETSFRPIDVYRMFGDVRRLGGANMTGLAFLDGLWMRDQRGLILTGFLDSMKASDGVRVRRRSLVGVFLLAIVLALGISGYLHIQLPYTKGAVTMSYYVYQGNPVWAFNDASTVLSGSRGPLPFYATLNFAIGVLVTIGLTVARARLLWFPLYPLAYALSGTWTMMVFWCPCVVAWLCKVFVLRYGGMPGYTRLRPFFLGMVLGEFTMAVLWTVPSLVAGQPLPTPFFPWP